MATLAKLEEALHNADAAGDVDAARQLAEAVKYHPERGMSGTEKFLVGAGASLDKARRGIGQLFGADTSQGDADAATYQDYRPGGWQTTAGEVAGDVAAMAPAALVPGGLLPQALAAASLGAAETPGGVEERGKAAAWGLGGAAAGAAIAKGASRLVKPVGVDTPAEQYGKTLDAMSGVERSFGQEVSRGGGLPGKVIDRIEEYVADAPLVGAPLREARERAEGAIAQRAAKHGPQGFERQLMEAPAGMAATRYRPSLVHLAEDLPVTRMEREQAHALFTGLRRRYLGNPSGERPTALAVHGVERELRAAAEQAAKDAPGYSKLLNRLADEYGSVWRAELSNAEQYAVKGFEHELSEAARKAAQVIPEDTLGRLLRSGVRHGLPGVAGLAIGGPVPTLAAAGGAYLYGKPAVQKYLTGRLNPSKQQAIAKALRAGARPAAIGGGVAGVEHAQE